MKSSDETLDDLGWKPWFSEQLSGEEAARCLPARVMAVHRGKIAVTGAGWQDLVSPYIAGAAPTDDHPTVGAIRSALCEPAGGAGVHRERAQWSNLARRWRRERKAGLYLHR